jgi:hypothetical protein
LAYSFSAPTATITLDFVLADASIGALKQSAVENTRAYARTTRGAIRRDERALSGVNWVIMIQ